MSGGLNCTDIPCTDRPSQLATFSAITPGRRSPASSSSPAPAGWIIGRYRRRGRSPFQGSAGGTSTLKPQANLRNPNHKPHGIFSQTNCQHVPAECLVVRRVRVGPRHTAAEAGPGLTLSVRKKNRRWPINAFIGFLGNVSDLPFLFRTKFIKKNFSPRKNRENR